MCRDLSKLQICLGAAEHCTSPKYLCWDFRPSFKPILIDNGDHGYHNFEVCRQFTATDL